MAETEVERERDLDRFLTFVDAVVAIAITLLVLPLVEITGEITGEVADEGTVADLLREHQAELWAFLLSFAVISRLWFAQHRTMRHVVAYHDRVARLLVLWMLAIVFLPFPTALVAETSGEPLTKILYVGTMTAGTLVLGVVQVVLVRTPRLSDGGGYPDPAQTWASAAMMLLALGIMLAAPATSYFPLLLLLLADNVVRGWRRLRRGGSGTTRMGG